MINVEDYLLDYLLICHYCINNKKLHIKPNRFWEITLEHFIQIKNDIKKGNNISFFLDNITDAFYRIKKNNHTLSLNLISKIIISLFITNQISFENIKILFIFNKHSLQFQYILFEYLCIASLKWKHLQNVINGIILYDLNSIFIIRELADVCDDINIKKQTFNSFKTLKTLIASQLTFDILIKNSLQFKCVIRRYSNNLKNNEKNNENKTRRRVTWDDGKNNDNDNDNENEIDGNDIEKNLVCIYGLLISDQCDQLYIKVEHFDKEKNLTLLQQIYDKLFETVGNPSWLHDARNLLVYCGVCNADIELVATKSLSFI